MRFSLFYVNYCLFFCSSSIVAHSSIVRFDYCLTIVTWQWRTNEWNPHTAVCVCVTLCDVMHSLCALWPLWKTLNKFYECPDITMSIVITLSFMLWLLNFNTCLSLIALSDFFPSNWILTLSIVWFYAKWMSTKWTKNKKRRKWNDEEEEEDARAAAAAAI